ncbi:MAG: hypothetical protein RL654_1090 [Pseudomonadota bacterium]
MNRVFKRSLAGVAALALVVGLSACGSAPFGGRGGPEGEGPRMGMKDRHEHGPRSEADHQKMRERMVERITAQLELDAVQKGHLVRLMDTLQAQRTAMTGDAAQAGRGGPGMLPPQQMQELVKGERFDRARAQTLVDEKTQAARAAAPQVIAAMGDFYDSLKPEQQAKVRTFLERGPGRGFMGGGRHHG